MNPQRQSYFSVSSSRVPIRNTADYSPFGVQLDGRTIQGDFYRRGFNGMEKDDEVKGGGNSYDFGARIYDSRVGRWLTIDPLEGKYPAFSTYNFVVNNPIIFIDPDGEKVKFSKNLDPEERREYKAHIKTLRQGSPTFNKIYKDLKKSKDIYTYDKTDECGGDRYEDESKTFFINLNGNNEGFDIYIVIAHETGHAWRDLLNLDIKTNESPYAEGSIEDAVFTKKVELLYEFEATHIENVIRNELGQELREDYGIKSDYNAASDRVILLGKEYLDISKKRSILIGKDSNYDYTNKKTNHYDNLKKRKHELNEININNHENPEKYH